MIGASIIVNNHGPDAMRVTVQRPNVKTVERSHVAVGANLTVNLGPRDSFFVSVPTVASVTL